MRLLALAALIVTTLPAWAEDAFRWVADPAFQDAGAPHLGVVPLKQGDLWGFMGLDGQWAAEPQFEAVGAAGLGWFAVQKGGKWGYFEVGGVPRTDYDFDAIGTPATYTPMKWQGTWYAQGPDGRFDDEALPFDTLIGNDGTCMVGTANGAFIVVVRGAEPSAHRIEGVTQMSPPSEGYVAVRLGKKAGHIDCASGTFNGGEAPYDEARPYGQGLAAVRVGEAWNYVETYDNASNYPDGFAAAREFAEGLAPVQDAASGKWGYIDRSGRSVIQPAFDQAYSFSDGLAGVQVGDKRGFILPNGTFAADPQFDDFWRHDGGLVPVRVGDAWGVIAPYATDPATKLTLPLEALSAAQTDRAPGFTLQPSNPHYYVVQDVASFHSIFVAADESVMVTTLHFGLQGELGLWDFRTHRLIRKIKMEWATQAVLLPGRQILAVGLETGYVVLLDAVTGAELHRVHPHVGAVIDMVLSPDGATLATTDGATIQLWDTATGAQGAQINEPAHKLRFSRDGATLYAGTVRGGLTAMTPEGEVLARQPEGPPLEYDNGPYTGAVPGMALTADGVLVNIRTVFEVQADTYYHPRSWLEVVTVDGARRIDLPKGMRDILTLDVSADGKLVAYAGQNEPDDGSYVAIIEVRDLATGAVMFNQALDSNDKANEAGLTRFIYSVDRLGFAPQGGLVVVGMEGQDILLIDPVLGKLTASFAAPLTGALSATGMLSGSRYFASDGDGKVWVWDLAQGRLEAVVPTNGLSFGVEERIETEGNLFYLFSGMDDGVATGFDMATMTPLPLTNDEQAAISARMDYEQAQTYPPDLQARLDALTFVDYATALDNGRLGVVSDQVGLHRAYDLATGALLAEFLATPDGEWLVVTPEGFFAASENGAKLVSVSTGLRAFSVDQVYQALYRPDLVAAKLAGDPLGEVARAAQELDLSRVLGSGPAPYTRFSLPRDGSLATEPEIQIEIELQDEGGGIGRVEWRLNGLTVDVQARSAAPLVSDAATATTRVALEPGLNTIEVIAYNAAGLLASAPRTLTVEWDGVASSEPPALHVLAVGVNDYADGRLQLKYAAADAQAFGDAMKKAGTGLFSSVNVVTLLDADVTAAKLDAAFADMGKVVKSQDVFLFFLAGHGKTVEGKYYFIPQDFRFAGDDPIRAGGIDQDRWQEWAARVKAKKSVMIYDTCESGSVTESRSVDGAMAQSAAVERLTRATGRTILSASTDDAPALEGYQGHGVMTWSLLDALAEGDTNGNSTIEVTELASYLDVKVPEISASAFGFRQVPQMSIKGSDFALGASVAVLGDAPERFPATLTHVVAGGTPVMDAPGGVQVMVIDAGVFFGVFRIEERDGFARIAKDGNALGWVPAAALVPLQ